MDAQELLSNTYLMLADALEYPDEQRATASLADVLEDALHMIELGHRYLDAEDRGLVSRWSD
jgi:hypothetical protein